MNISSVWASTQTTQPSAWSATPTLSQEAYPAYEFQSTSTCAPVVGITSYTSDLYTPAANAPRQLRTTNPWGKPTGPEIGVIDTPVGEPFVLLAMAVLYFIYRRIRTKSLFKTRNDESAM